MSGPRRSPVRALFGALVIGALAGLVPAGPAAAHNTLRSTTPAADAAVGVAPPAIVLTFDEPAIAMGTRVVVTGPSGPVQAGEPQLVDNTVTQPLQAGLPAGRYVVEWRATSADGHPITGTFVFTAAAAGGGGESGSTVATAAPSPPTAGGGSGWGALVAVTVLVVVLAGLLYVFRRARGVAAPRYDRSASTSPPDVDSRTESRPPTDD